MSDTRHRDQTAPTNTSNEKSNETRNDDTTHSDHENAVLQDSDYEFVECMVDHSYGRYSLKRAAAVHRTKGALSIVQNFVAKLSKASTKSTLEDNSTRISIINKLEEALTSLQSVIEPINRKTHHGQAPRSNVNFFTKVKQQLQDRPWPVNSTAGHAASVILKHLEYCEPALGHQPDQRRDAYFLPSQAAHTLLEGSDRVDVPVFTNSAETLKWRTDDKERPILELLERFPDDEAVFTYRCQQCPHDYSFFASTNIKEMRARTTAAVESEYPRNFVDLPSPLPGRLLPDCLRGSNCNLLMEMKTILDHDASNSIGLLKQEEEVVLDRLRNHDILQRYWRQFDQVFLLAETGALTAPHTDPFGTGTWITCQEGRIGFAWLSNPNAQLLERWRADQDSCFDSGRWLYRVLRQGDTVYFGPGTIHFVFRRPDDLPTLALAGHIVRKSDVDVWLKTLSWQIEDAISEGSGELALVDIVPQLLTAMQRVLVRTDDHNSERQQCLRDRCTAFISDQKLEVSLELIKNVNAAIQTLAKMENVCKDSIGLSDHQHEDVVGTADVVARNSPQEVSAMRFGKKRRHRRIGYSKA